MDELSELLTTDTITDVLPIIRGKRLRVDPQYRGECLRLSENAGIRLNYFSRHGLTIDALGAELWSRGLTNRRPTCNETLEILERLFVLAPSAVVEINLAEQQRDDTAIDAEELAIKRRRKSRNRLYECSACGKKIRTADDHLDASHHHNDPDTGERSSHPFVRVTPLLKREPF